MENEYSSETGRKELAQIRAEINFSIGRRLLFWGIRFLIGLCMVVVVTYFAPGWWWLWYVWGGAAGLSLLAIIVGSFVTKRKFDNADAVLEKFRSEEAGTNPVKTGE